MKLLEASLARKLAYALTAGFAIGIIWFIGLRTILLEPEYTHYHANFALYIDNKRDSFESYVFYEEEAACAADKSDPRTRVHMHDNVNHVVHVHDKGVTWSDFFANLGYAVGDKVLQTRDAVYVDDQAGKHLSFILNGQPVTSVADRVIGNTDRLLISYGTDDTKVLNSQFAAVEHDADEVNKKSDPASCGGGSIEETFWNRLRRAAWQSSE